MGVPRKGTGLIVGKFYPPHRGHLALLEFGASQVEQLFIFVCDAPKYSIPGALRFDWLKRLAPANAKVLLVEERHAADDSPGWAQRTIQLLGFAPEKVFTSEAYGDPFCACLGSTHVPFDPPRKRVTISGTAVRENPWKSWEFLPEPVRGYYAARVAIVGAESSGKTTLAEQLAGAYRTNWVPEYGRTYCESRPTERPWREEEFVEIASRQNVDEKAAAEACNRLLFCDTTSNCTSIWHRRYLGEVSQKVRAVGAGRSYALTLFCESDFPFVQDGTRDGEQIREEMAGWMKADLEARGVPYVTLRGGRTERLAMARAAIDQLPASRYVNC